MSVLRGKAIVPLSITVQGGGGSAIDEDLFNILLSLRYSLISDSEDSGFFSIGNDYLIIDNGGND